MQRILAGILHSSVFPTLIVPGVALVFMLGLGCNDYNFDESTDWTDDDAGDDDDDDDDTSNTSDDDAAGDDDASDDDDTDVGADDDASDDDGDDDDDPPPELIDTCEGAEGFTFQDTDGDGWLVVLSWSPTEESGIIWVDTTAVYHLYDSYIAESGASQTNESGYLTISNSQNPSGYPTFANGGDYWIVTDSDNNGNPPQQAIYIGTFLLVAGEDNLITLRHYCPLYRSGQCQSFHIGDPYDSSGCEDGGVNSIHMDLAGICLIAL
jgi:hypothetical protein